ncbi:MAG: flagellar motor switch protein FliN [Chloroflexi bacterium]|jgi:flagellar motor switch protein FliN/FliY|nr:flagellar motor switch protein FliN [Anaerolineaceae bacterium]NMB90552.1 flagellar motor switch protein FliN [Chloroflexota bacterium]
MVDLPGNTDHSQNSPTTFGSKDPANSAGNLSGPAQASLDMLMDVPLMITVELGRTQMTLKHALDLQQGSVVELERLAGDPVDVFINERLVARGEVVVVDDKFAVRVTELISSNKQNAIAGEQ